MIRIHRTLRRTAVDNKRFVELGSKCDLFLQNLFLFFFHFIIYFRWSVIVQSALPYRDDFRMPSKFPNVGRTTSYIVRMRPNCGEEMLMFFCKRNGLF